MAEAATRSVDPAAGGLDPAARVAAATLEASRIGELDRDRLLGILDAYSFARITGLVAPEAIDRSRELLARHFRVENDRPVTGEAVHEVRDNFQKLSIGRARHGGVDRPRFMRVFYNPLWAEDVYEMRESFRTVCRVRNLLAGFDLDFATDREERGAWTAARIHHFPAGGGFMCSHRDTVLPGIYEDIGLGPFFQPLLLLSSKGVDYETGGGFVEVDGVHLCYEDHCRKGDIVVYDTRTVHGVDDVDVTKPFVQDSLAGRMGALVTLYKAL